MISISMGTTANMTTLACLFPELTWLVRTEHVLVAVVSMFYMQETARLLCRLGTKMPHVSLSRLSHSPSLGPRLRNAEHCGASLRDIYSHCKHVTLHTMSNVNQTLQSYQSTNVSSIHVIQERKQDEAHTHVVSHTH